MIEHDYKKLCRRIKINDAKNFSNTYSMNKQPSRKKQNPTLTKDHNQVFFLFLLFVNEVTDDPLN